MRIANIPTALALLLPNVLGAQVTELNRAFELERMGRYEEAAEHYKALLREDYASLAALLGLERTSERTGRYDTLLILTDSTIALRPNRIAYGVKLRTWARLENADSLASIVGRWIDAEPQSPNPYKEWAAALAQQGNVEEAVAVLRSGIERVGDSALSLDLAKLLVRSGEWTQAAKWWSRAVTVSVRYVQSAVQSLVRTPPLRHDLVVRELVGSSGSGASRAAKVVASELLAQWDRPLEAWVLLDQALPDDARAAVGLLRRFAEQLRRGRGPEGARARGFALERLGQRLQGELADAALLEAARAFLEAGDDQAAERLLARVGADSERSSPAQISAMVGLIRTLAQAGAVEQAERRFRDWADRLRSEDERMLREAIAWGWIEQDSLDRAEGLLAGDSSVSTAAILGWIALFRGDIESTVQLFRAAGPRAGSREDATRRTEILALLQRVAMDSLPGLGAALHSLMRGDSAQATGVLAQVAESLPDEGGGADALALAGRVALGQHQFELAERLLLRSIERDVDGPSAATAQFELAKVYIAIGRRTDAANRLEGVILNYPMSAVVPSARRLLDRVTQAIPAS